MNEIHNNGMTVGDLRKALEGVPDDMEIALRFAGEDGNDGCGFLRTAGVEHTYDDGDTPFFALDGDDCDHDDEEAGS